MSKIKYILDNDVFLAALSGGHDNHKTARAWLDKAKPQGWGIAVETYLAAVRLLMNPAVMQEKSMKAGTAIAAVDMELAGKYPAEIIFAKTKPSKEILSKAKGHRQIMDFWLVQIAREAGCKLVTNDGGTLGNWPAETVRPE